MAALPAFAQNVPTTAGGNARYDVRAYVVEGAPLLSTNILAPVLARHMGTNLGVDDLVSAAADVQAEYFKQGLPPVSVSIAEKQITNGIVTLHVFHGAVAQVLVSGRRYLGPGIATTTTTAPLPEKTTPAPAPAAPATNNVRHFVVLGYKITGNSLIPDDTLDAIFLKRTGTNVTEADIQGGMTDLQLEYRQRGYVTVSVRVPKDQSAMTNGIFSFDVFEGRLASITVSQNRFFSSNNVMRAMPGLHTNMLLNRALFEAELDRANANRDRQIYPNILPGPDANTSSLDLVVRDRLPLHGKVELNNQNSPGTPDLRLNGSAVYDNLWQHEHSIGMQYSASPDAYKRGDQWNLYDKPLVANYSGFYRMPLGNFAAVADEVAAQPGNFGYDEASRKFRLPPPSGRPELNVYASRSTIDTGLEQPTPDVLLHTSARTITKGTEQEDLTVNEGLGFRLTAPLPEEGGVRSTVSGGLDYKYYDIKSDKAFVYQFVEILHHTPGDAGTVQVGTLRSPVPRTEHTVRYLPLSLRWDAGRQDRLGRFDFGLGYSVNFAGGLFESNRETFQTIAGSSHADGFYHVLTASLARDNLLFRTGNNEWRLVLRADGQWANQPLISNEQFGDGGIAGVRSYHEGEVFGDTGWRVTSEIKTPPYIVGQVNGPSLPLIVRGSVFMDYGETYLLDPQGRNDDVGLWGAGAGFVASVGTHWEARFLFGWPLLSTFTTEANQPRLNFALSVQF